jgi:hypothetical protein
MADDGVAPRRHMADEALSSIGDGRWLTMLCHLGRQRWLKKFSSPSTVGENLYSFHVAEREGATRHFPPYASSKFDGTSDGLPKGADAKLTV